MMYYKKCLVLLLLLIVFPVRSVPLKSDIKLKSNSYINTSVNETELKLVKDLLDKGETDEALKKLYLIIDKAKNDKNMSLFIEGNILLGDVQRENGNYSKSTEIYNDLIPLIKSDFKRVQYLYFKKGGNFQLDNQIDSAQFNYQKAVNLEKRIEGSEDLKAKIHANLSGIYYLKANYNKAIEHSKIAANFQKTLGNSEIEAGILNNLGGIYFMQGDYKKALSSFQSAFDIVGYGQSDLQKKTRNSAYINIAYAYSGLDNYEKAFEYQDKFFSLNDSLQQELKYKEITEIKSKYDIEKKEKEAAIEKGKRKETEVLAFSLGIAILVLLSGIYGLFKLNKLNKKNHALRLSQENLISQNEIEQIKSEAHSKILVATLDGRLEERKKISEVLHGNVGGLLSAANLHLYTCQMQLKNGVSSEIDKSVDIIKEASEIIRNLSHELVSSVLIQSGLNEAVKDVCKKVSNTAISLKYNSENIDRYELNFELKVFNMINELINNILKHSKAESGVVKLEHLKGQLYLSVSDDGIGINMKTKNPDAGIGLTQVQSRIKSLNGKFKIKTSLDRKGTTILISIPIVY